MTWDQLRSLGDLTSKQRGDSLTIAFVRDTMGTVRECIAAIHDQLVKRGYRFRNPAAAFPPASSASESLVKEIEAPAPNRRPRFPLMAFSPFLYLCCALPSSPTAVGKARR